MYQLRVKLFHKCGDMIAVWTESFSSESDRKRAMAAGVGTKYDDGSYLQLFCI